MVFTATHFSRYAVAYVETTFSDIAALKWAKQAIETMTSRGVLTGTGDSLFGPGASISRAEFTDALIKALGLSARFESNFRDVPSTSAYYDSIGAARKLGIANGVGANDFKPDAPITRQEMAALVVRGLKAAGKPVAAGTAADLRAFADASMIAPYAAENVAALVKGGILQGDGKNLLPAGEVTRAQSAALMGRIYKLQ